MKIGEFSDSFIPIVDGVARVVKAYADNLSARGDEVYVITPMDDTGYRGRFPFEIVDFRSFSIKDDIPWKVGFDQIDRHFADRMKMIDLDICHVHSPGFAGHAGIQYAKSHKVPLVGSFHSKYYDDFMMVTHSRAISKFGIKVVVDFYNRCDEVWAVSENAAQTLKDYGFNREIAVMPNGTERRIINLQKVPETVERFKIRTDVPVLLFVGQINFKKNLRRTVEACSLLKKNGTDFQLVMAGMGPDAEAVRNLAESKGLSENLIMTGHINDSEILDSLYYISDLFVFPSIYDNAPMVLREAACQHTPALVIRGSSSSEVITDMVNGLVTEDTNIDVYRAIKKFLSLDADAQKKMGDNACNTIPRDWNGPLMDDIRNRYRALVGC